MDFNYVQKLVHVFRFDCLKSLHLDDCKLYDQLLIPLFSALSTNLSKLSLKNNYLTDNVIKMIVCNCQLKHSLQVLNLSGNKITNLGLGLLKDYVISNPQHALKELNIAENLLIYNTEFDTLPYDLVKLELSGNIIKSMDQQTQKLKNVPSVMAQIIVSKQETVRNFKLESQAVTMQLMALFYSNYQQMHRYLTAN